jgi:hypothetical protein
MLLLSLTGYALSDEMSVSASVMMRATASENIEAKADVNIRDESGMTPQVIISLLKLRKIED